MFVFDNSDKKQPTVTTLDWPVYIRPHPPKERAADSFRMVGGGCTKGISDTQ